MSEQWQVQRAKALSTKLIPNVSLDTHGSKANSLQSSVLHTHTQVNVKRNIFKKQPK